MKQVFKLTIVAAILTMTYSCSEDLLDNSGNASTSQPTSSLTSAQAENAALTNPAVTAAFVNGTLLNFKRLNVITWMIVGSQMS